jgi:hypothetical protein
MIEHPAAFARAVDEFLDSFLPETAAVS